MPGEIEFLDPEPTPGDDAYLAQPSSHGRSGLGCRGRVVAGLGIAALSVGVLVARAVSSGDQTPVAAPSTSLPTVGTVPSAPSPSAATLTFDPSTGLAVGLSAESCLPSNQIGQTIRLPTLRSIMSFAPGWGNDLTSPSVPIPRSGSSPNSIPLLRGSNAIGTIQLPDVPIVGGEASAASGGLTRCMMVGPAQCPKADDGQVACQVTRDVPPAVLAAVRARYPNARVTFAYTEIVRQTRLIWYRLIRFSISPGIALVITLDQPSNDEGPSVVIDNSTTQQARAVRAGSRLNTVIDVIAASSKVLDFGLPTELASDRRLATVG